MGTDEVSEVLNRAALYRSLAPAQREMLSRVSCQRSVCAETLLLSINQPCDGVHLLLCGSVKVMAPHGATGQSTILNILGAGELLGEMSALEACSHSADVFALEECETLRFEPGDFVQCLSNIPALALNVARIQSKRLRFLSTHYRVRNCLDIDGRLAWQLLHFAAQNGETDTKGGITIGLRLRQSDLAALVGAQRETVNRVLSGWQNRRLLSLGANHRYTLHDTAALSRLCDEIPAT